MSKIATYLNQHITGATYGAPSVLDAYATDASILKIRPKIVAVPKTTSDIRRLLRFSNQLATKNIRLPITVRGSGTSKTGAAIGSGMIISMEKMNNIQEIDARQRLIRVQAGVTLGQLNSALALHGLTLPVVANPLCTIGGLIASGHAKQSTSGRKMITHFVNQAEVVLSSGDLIQTERLPARRVSKKQGIDNFEGELYRKFCALLEDNTNVSLPSNNLAGYSSVFSTQLKNKSLDMLPVFFGSEGTLGVITEVILNCAVITPPPQYFVATCPDASSALGIIARISLLDPCNINIYDISLFNTALDGGKKFRPLRTLPKNGVLVVATFDDSQKRHRAKKIKQLKRSIGSRFSTAISTPDNYDSFVELESILSVYLNQLPRATHAPIADDVFIPDNQLKKYFLGLSKLEEKYQTTLPVFGSILYKNYSVRPALNLGSVTGRQFVLTFLRDYDRLVDLCEGALAGATPEGRLKAPFVNERLGSDEAKLYHDLKNIFDPNRILNPDIKQSATLRAVVRQLRTSYNLGIIT